MASLSFDQEEHVRAVIASASLCVGLLSANPRAANAQDTVFFPPANRIAIRDMRAVPAVALSDRLRIHTIVGATGSVSFGELDSGAVVPPHHHTREQADVTLTGRMAVTLDHRTESLPSSYGVLIPVDVSHSLVNPGPGRATAIEFHTVPRPDLVPPRPTVAFPSAAVDTPLLDAARAIGRMETASGTTMSGKTCVVRWRWVRTTVDVHPAPTPTELFIYVARGSAEVDAEGRTTTLREGSLLMIPASLSHARIRSLDGPSAGLLEFHVHTP